MRRRILVILLFITATLGFIYVFRVPILQSFATYLICEDKLEKADAIVVLSGGGYDRGNEAAKIYREGFAPEIVCTGGNPALEFKVFNIDTLESDVTVANLRRLRIPDSAIVEIRQGTSTKEEAEVILNYAKEQQHKNIIIISSKLHTYRVNKVFRKKLKEAGIELIVHGCFNSRFDEMQWWQDENGLIAVNNEWIKTFYYWFKY